MKIQQIVAALSSLCWVVNAVSVKKELLQYADLPGIGVNCPSRHSCDHRNADTNLDDRNCECDSLCNVYGDCCIDVTTPADLEADVIIDNPRCLSFDSNRNMGAFFIADCPYDYDGPKELSEMCRSDSSKYKMSAPVTDLVTNITYRNDYCSECNGIFHNHLQSWSINMECDGENLTASNIPLILNISYNSQKQSWELHVGGDFTTCTISYTKPKFIDQLVRPCRPNLVSSCPEGWSNNSIRKKCNRYMAVVYTQDGTAYKNPHCATCNGINTADLLCNVP